MLSGISVLGMPYDELDLADLEYFLLGACLRSFHA